MIDIGVKTTSSSINFIKQVEEGQVQSDSLMTLTSESFSIRKVFFGRILLIAYTSLLKTGVASLTVDYSL